ncbi:MAG: hypothetical protein GY699_00400 [Desulfobacteraceae bacterium]|nr:hypothetical protein [Desulfobacteraceae bacterium]
MIDSKKKPDKKRLTCPICNSTFLNIFPAGECQTCSQLVCGHCIYHDDPDHPASICQDCMEKMTPYGRIAQMDSDSLLQILKDPASKDSALVARQLGDRQDVTFVDPLCKALKSDRIDVRREAAIALGRLKNNNAIPALMTALNDSAPATRGHAASSLAKLGAKDALPQLKKQVDDPSRQAAGYAVQALGKLMGRNACDLFKHLVQNHSSNFIRVEALAVLAGLSHEMALTAALECLDDPKKEVVISACKILTRLNDLEAAPKLEKLIESKPSASVRIMAKTTLNKLLEINS